MQSIRNTDVKVLTIGGDLIATIDSYTSLICDVSLHEIGTAEMHINLAAQGAADIRIGHLLYLARDRVWVVDDFEATEKHTTTLKIKAKQLKRVLSQRLVLPGQRSSTEFYGWERFPAPDDPDVPAEVVMRHYVSSQAIAPEEPARILPALILGANGDHGDLMRWSARFEPMDKVLTAIGQSGGVGWDVQYDIATHELVFVAIPYHNQTVGTEQPVIFSVEFENLEGLTYKDSLNDYSNFLYGGGAGTDENRLVLGSAKQGEPIPTGYDRIESWEDLGSASTVDDLQYEIQHKLSEVERQESMSGDAIDGKSYVYRRDWDVGSIVTVRSRSMGLSIDQLVTSVRETYENGVMRITPTFGRRKKNIVDEIRKTEKVR